MKARRVQDSKLSQLRSRLTFIVLLLLSPALLTAGASWYFAYPLQYALAPCGVMPLLFVLLTFAVAQGILPVRLWQQRRDMFGAFFGWLIGWQRESFFIADAKAKRTLPNGPLTEKIGGFVSGLPFFSRMLQVPLLSRLLKLMLGMPGLIIVDSHSVVLTMQAVSPHRVLGSGFHFCDLWEFVPIAGDRKEFQRIPEVIDLRRQIRFHRVPDAVTKDNLACTAGLFAIFQAGRLPDSPIVAKTFFHYEESEIWNVINAVRIGEQPNEWHDWTQIPKSEAAGTLLDIVATYELDELYAPRYTSQLNTLKVREQIRKELIDTIQASLRKEYGIFLIIAGVTAISPANPAVTTQRVARWRADWQSKVKHDAVTTQLQVAESKNRVRAQVHNTVIGELSQELKKIEAEYHTNLRVLLFIAAIEKMVAEMMGRREIEPASDA